VKMVRITLCTFRTATSSPNARPAEFVLKRFATTVLAKITVQNRANRAGATPVFCGRAAQKFRGVAPALAGTSRRRFARLPVQTQGFVRQNV
jgi:hypothetical protein